MRRAYPTKYLPGSMTHTKSLSGNQYLGEDELGAGQLYERQVVLSFLLPTYH
jgi:hypothetical protein